MAQIKKIEYPDGTKRWYLSGRLHREDGPAIEKANGTKKWYLNGQLNREDGPAIEYSDGNKSWYLNGIGYSEEEFKKEIAKYTVRWYWYFEGEGLSEKGPVCFASSYWETPPSSCDTHNITYFNSKATALEVKKVWFKSHTKEFRRKFKLIKVRRKIRT